MDNLNIIKPLGLISKEQQEEFWVKNVSGSRLKRIINTNDRIKEFFIATGKATSDFQQDLKTMEKMQRGTDLEDYIVKSFASKAGFGDRVVIDKRTFVLDNINRVHANIDAFIMSEEGYQKWLNKEISDDDRYKYMERIIEVKNTEKDNESLLLWYSSQAKFYSWFFNLEQKPYIVYLRNGWQIGHIEVEYSRDQFLTNELQQILEWINCVDNNVEPELLSAITVEEQPIQIENSQETIDIVNTYIELKEQEKLVGEQVKLLKNQILTKVLPLSDAKKIQLINKAEPMLSLVETEYGAKKDWETWFNLLNTQYLQAINLAKQDNIDLTKYFKFDSNGPEKTPGTKSRVLRVLIKKGK